MTTLAVSLAAQELNWMKRSDDFVNPYRKQVESAKVKKTSKKAKEKKQRGPSISRKREL